MKNFFFLCHFKRCFTASLSDKSSSIDILNLDFANSDNDMSLLISIDPSSKAIKG